MSDSYRDKIAKALGYEEPPPAAPEEKLPTAIEKYASVSKKCASEISKLVASFAKFEGMLNGTDSWKEFERQQKERYRYNYNLWKWEID